MVINKQLKEYRGKIWCDISKYDEVLQNRYENPILYRNISKYEGVIYTDFQKPLTFIDNATLKIEETVKFDNNNHSLIGYSYHYERYNQDGSIEFYFRYDKDPDATKPESENFSQQDWEICHALNHLHVNKDEPRYKTHEINFTDVFNLIRLNYYKSKTSN